MNLASSLRENSRLSQEVGPDNLRWWNKLKELMWIASDNGKNSVFVKDLTEFQMEFLVHEEFVIKESGQYKEYQIIW